MTAPDQQQQAQGIGKIGFATAGFMLAAAIVAGLRDPQSEGRRFVPYKDSAGYWTVCAGITGPDVIPGRTYTVAECDVLEVTYVNRMLARMGGCVQGEVVTFAEAKYWGEFTVNTGDGGFCASTAARLLNEGRNREACDQILRWKHHIKPAGMATTAPGVWWEAPSKKHPSGRWMFDCSTPGNKTCMGLWTRRQREHAECVRAIG